MPGTNSFSINTGNAATEYRPLANTFIAVFFSSEKICDLVMIKWFENFSGLFVPLQRKSSEDNLNLSFSYWKKNECCFVPLISTTSDLPFHLFFN